MKTNLNAPFGPVAGRDGSTPATQNDVAILPDEMRPDFEGQLPDDMRPDFGGQLPDDMRPDFGGQLPDDMRPDFGGQLPDDMRPDFGGQLPDDIQPDYIQLPDNMRPDVVPSGGSTAYVRFLNAVTDGAPLRITLGARLLATSLAPGDLTGYYTVPAGFRSLVLYDARAPWMILFRSSIPLSAGEVVTLAVVRSGAGVDLVRVDDRPCGGWGTSRACIRTVNLVYNSPGLDVLLTDGRALFTDVRFKEITTYRRARAGQYDMYVAQTPYVLPEDYVDIETVEEMPVAITNYFLPGFGVVEPLASFFLDARAGVRSTIYLMGNWNRSHRIQPRIVENY